MNRFSEDLDFSLLHKDTEFELKPFLNAVVEEFNALGIHVSLKQKAVLNISNIDSAFLKSETLWSELIFESTIPQIKFLSKPSIKIKIEVDTDPPLNFETENLLLSKPFSFYVNCFTLANLFAGKIHALLFRKWKNRVKGRDWYDMEWYIRNGVEMNLEHFCQRAIESGDWSEKSITKNQLLELLQAKINSTKIDNVKEDVIRFIQNPNELDIWSTDYFLQLCKLLKTNSKDKT